MSVGTGGTISGVSRYLKSKNENIEVYAVDPDGSGIASYLERSEFVATGSSITEGIGIMRLTENFKSARVDFPLRVPDQDMIDMCHHLARNDGLVLGSSAALNLAAALKIGLKHKNSNKVIVTILCDHGSRYFTKLFNQDFLKDKNLIPRAIPG